ncbi:hypothetical protein R8Z57_12780 [Microbacterium sp. M3]|uniref:Uncharacterized protein n=1 Tax=Microbacterium arthrosphaerae TaxID=792652 RepID=A0ABU4H2S8_9MICO|nr:MULTISPECIES: hypothetical protein [Microbacterium]MDW4573648.1 hypothetical protein [Microbacterium arthrosphaerae]MDW7607503.1 hypothetical protein [Microbacterium sp. M3]
MTSLLEIRGFSASAPLLGEQAWAAASVTPWCRRSGEKLITPIT